jgi:hypothetical protein
MNRPVDMRYGLLFIQESEYKSPRVRRENLYFTCTNDMAGAMVPIL